MSTTRLQVKTFDQFGNMRRVYNEKFKDGAKSLKAPTGITTDGPYMYIAEGTPDGWEGVQEKVEQLVADLLRVPPWPTISPPRPLQFKNTQVGKFIVDDNRATSTKHEEPDQAKGTADAHVLDVPLQHAHGLAHITDGVEGKPTLYVADTGHHRIIALDPKTMTPRFVFAREGGGEGELRSPRGVAAMGETLVVADAGNYRVCVFSLRGTFQRAIGERPPRPIDRPSFFTNEPHHVSLAEGCIMPGPTPLIVPRGRPQLDAFLCLPADQVIRLPLAIAGTSSCSRTMARVCMFSIQPRVHRLGCSCRRTTSTGTARARSPPCASATGSSTSAQTPSS